MKIGIDAHAAERDGSGNCTYIRNFLKALKEIDNKNEYIFYAINTDHSFYKDFPCDEKLEIKQLPVRNPLIRIPFFLARQSLIDSLDILHVQYVSPPYHRGKLVVTIHDLGFLHFPEYFSKFEAFRSKIFVRYTAKKSARIITGSNFSKNDISNTYMIDSQRIEVIPYGVSSRFRPEKDEKKQQRILDKYNIKGKYILSVGRLNPRKNLNSLVQAYTSLKVKNNIPHKLVIAGKEDYDTKNIVQAARKINPDKDIIFTGFVADDDLPSLYSGAEVFVFPSLFEGVGLPVLEAMSCGVPVVTSDTSSLKEIVGDAGIMVNPLSVDEIARAIVQMGSDEELRNGFIKRGISRARNFSWKLTAQKTLRIYEEVYAERRR